MNTKDLAAQLETLQIHMDAIKAQLDEQGAEVEEHAVEEHAVEEHAVEESVSPRKIPHATSVWASFRPASEVLYGHFPDSFGSSSKCRTGGVLAPLLKSKRGKDALLRLCDLIESGKLGPPVDHVIVPNGGRAWWSARVVAHDLPRHFAEEVHSGKGPNSAVKFMAMLDDVDNLLACQAAMQAEGLSGYRAQPSHLVNKFCRRWWRENVTDKDKPKPKPEPQPSVQKLPGEPCAGPDLSAFKTPAARSTPTHLPSEEGEILIHGEQLWPPSSAMAHNHPNLDYQTVWAVAHLWQDFDRMVASTMTPEGRGRAFQPLAAWFATMGLPHVQAVWHRIATLENRHPDRANETVIPPKAFRTSE